MNHELFFCDVAFFVTPTRKTHSGMGTDARDGPTITAELQAVLKRRRQLSVLPEAVPSADTSLVDPSLQDRDAAFRLPACLASPFGDATEGSPGTTGRTRRRGASRSTSAASTPTHGGGSGAETAQRTPSAHTKVSIRWVGANLS